MEFFYRTDLACEVISGSDALPDGVKYESFEDEFGNKTERMYIPESLERKIGKRGGNYVTVNCKKLHELEDFELDAISEILSVELVRLIEKSIGSKLCADTGILVAGLGNISMTPDSIGPLTVQGLSATRHISQIDPTFYKKLGCCSLSTISPGVLGQTGIESSEIVGAAVECARPDVVVAIDALAAGSLERLGATFQLCDTGIRPGSGIGNKRRELTEKTLKVPVIVVGVPTVMDSSSLIYDTLVRCGKEKTADDLRDVLDNGKSFFVSPKECDEIVKSASRVLAAALNSAFGINA